MCSSKDEYVYTQYIHSIAQCWNCQRQESMKIRNVGFRIKQAWVRFPALPLTSTRSANSLNSAIPCVHKLKLEKQKQTPTTSSLQGCTDELGWSTANAWAFQVAWVVKNLPVNAEDTGSIPGSGRSPGEGNGYPTPLFLPGESHGQSMGLRRVYTTEVT